MSASVTKHKCYDFQRQRAPSVFYCNLQMKKEQLRIKLLPCEIPQGCPQANDGPGKQDQEEEIWRAFLPLPMVARSQKASVPTAMICKGFTPTPKSRAGADTLPPCSMTGAHTGHCCQSQVGWGMLQVHPTCGGERGVRHKGCWVRRAATESHGHGAGEALNSVEPALGKIKCLTISKEKQHLMKS